MNRHAADLVVALAVTVVCTAVVARGQDNTTGVKAASRSSCWS